MSVKDYNVEPELNVSISGISIAEGCAPSGINDALRQLMADVKEESEAQAQAVGEAVSEAREDASSQLSSLDSALRAFIAEEVAKYLPLAGGVMTGALTGVGYVQRLRNIDVTAVPPTAIYDTSIMFSDKNGKLFAMLQPVQWSNGGNALRVIVAKKDGSQGGGITLEQHADGKFSFASEGSDVITAAGGTLTGDLAAQDCKFSAKLTNFDVASAPASANFASPYYVTDKNGRLIYQLQATQWAGSVNNVLRFILGRKDGSQGATLAMTQPGSGDPTLTFEGNRVACPAKDVVVKSSTGTSIVCPSGGTWTYFVCVHLNQQQSRASFMSGTCAGGTALTHGEAAATNYYNGIFVRTA